MENSMTLMNDIEQAHPSLGREYKAPIGHKTVNQACRILGLSRSGFYQFVGEGRINVKRILGRPFVSDKEISRIIDGE